MAGAKILFIDDDPTITKLYETKLVKEGFEFISARDGGRGLQMALEEGPDVIILDLLMKDIPGEQVLSSLRAGDATKNIPILVLSNKGDATDKLLKLGATDYFVKANTVPKKVLEKIRTLLPAEGGKGKDAKPAVTAQVTRAAVRSEKVIPVPKRMRKAKAKAAGAPVEKKEKPLTEEEILKMHLAGIKEELKRKESKDITGLKKVISGRYKILMMEDDPIIARLYKAKFDFEGQESLQVDNGRDGLEKIATFHPDIILVDIRMPDMTGLEVLEQIKNQNIKVPVVVFTNSEDSDSQKKAMELGATAYMLKSQVTPLEVMQKIREILGSPDTKTESAS